eukprot:TRINITY_DN5006_c0_g1_i2.p1 TRINITY_DN5006_c0_g1~~TRINITY_DN5006_c0_g1_i2.p1  ORF type:complete len:489 (-),score=132.90 TRINITY_DN5006_c0_g1_i2:219-1685(-)
MAQWEVETDDGWKPFTPEKDFHGKPGEEIHFQHGSFSYRATFETLCNGFQENLKTGKRRKLRPQAFEVPDSPPMGCAESPIIVTSTGASASSSATAHANSSSSVSVSAGAAARNGTGASASSSAGAGAVHDGRTRNNKLKRRSSGEAQWKESLWLLRRDLIKAFPLVEDATHPIHHLLVKAEAAESEGRWEVAFNDLFEAQEALSKEKRKMQHGGASASSSSASASPLPDTMAVEPSASATSAKASLPVPPAALAASEPAPVVAMLPSPVSDKSMSAKAFNTSATAEAAATTAVTSQPLLEQMEKSLLGSECCRDELLRSVDGQGDGDDICSFSSLPLPESLEAKRSNATMGLSAAGTISESKKQQGPSTKEACSEEELAPEEVCNFSEPSSAASSAHRMEQGRESVENLEAPAKIGQTLEASNIQDSEVEEFAGNDQDDEDVLSPLASPLRQPGAGDGATTNADSTNQRGAWWSGSMSSFEESADIL